MNPTQYEMNVMITESCDFDAIGKRIDNRMIRLLHAGLGMSSELTELIDAADKDIIDWINVMEETADLGWYCSIATNAMGFDPEKISEYENSIKEIMELKPLDENTLEQGMFTLTYLVGEFNDLLKKHLMYGRELNTEKVKECLQKLCASLSGMCRVAGFTIEEARERNIAKLKKRFGNKFTEAAALNRDLDSERKILEGLTPEQHKVADDFMEENKELIEDLND